MPKKMLIDASHPEETRVVVLSGNRLEEFDFETAAKKQLKGNIYLARVTRVEPSLQAAFVEYGGNRHGFLAFSEIHPDYYRIPVADREALIEEERRAAADEDREERDEADEAAHAGDENSDEKPAKGRRRRPRRKSAKREDVETVSQEAPAAEAVVEAQAAEPTHPAGADVAADEDEERGEHAQAAETTTQPVRLEVIGGDDMAESAERRRTPNYRNYKIQEVIKRRQIMLVQVTKEERGNKGAALTTYLSLAGRYCVLMPNTPRGGGISRKIANPKDRKKMKAIMDDLEVPEGMAVILRTAGLERTRQEIKRDLDYLLRLWDSIRETTLQSTAPCAIHEEANLIKRAIRDLYSRDIDEIEVQGEDGYRVAKDFMRMLMPSHAKKVQLYKDDVTPLFHRNQVETQIDAMHSPVVQLKSGGYIVINPTEALVSIDVNSGRATRERNIEETAYRTNLEAADEVARQLRLRDLAGLIVVDFIDMEDDRHNAAVERRLKEAMRQDRARIQIGRISPFGLLELSRQRLRPSLLETHFETCPHCAGTGHVRSIGSAALSVLRAIEEEGIKGRASEIRVLVATSLALLILNQKRDSLQSIEQRYGLRVYLEADDTLVPPAHRIDKLRDKRDERAALPAPVDAGRLLADTARDYEEEEGEADETLEGEEIEPVSARAEPASRPQPRRDEARADDRGEAGERGGRRRRRRRRRRAPAGGGLEAAPTTAEAGSQEFGHDPREIEPAGEAEAEGEEPDGELEVMELGAQPVQGEGRRRRRGRRGGRRRGGAEAGPADRPAAEELQSEFEIATEFVEIDTTPREPEPRAIEPPAEEPRGTVELVAEPAEGSASAGEAAAPPKRRPSRRKPKAASGKIAAAEPEAEPVVEPTVEPEPVPEPVAEEAQAKPKRRSSRARKTEPALQPAQEPEPAVASEELEAETAAPEAEPTMAPTPAPSLAEVTIVGGAAETPEKPKRGWWNRIVKG